MTTIYRTGHNLPGCLPDSDDSVFATLDWESARASLLEELDRTAEEAAERANDLKYDDPDGALEADDALLEAVTAGRQLVELKPGSDFQVYIEGRIYWLEGSEPSDDEEARRTALADLEDVSLSDVKPLDWVEAHTYEIVGGYLFQVMTHEEAYEACVEYIRESVWAFNATWIEVFTPEGIGAEEIESIRGDRCEDANTGLIALIEAGRGMDEFISDSIGADGRGHFLSSYDGEERESGDFYIYQV